jgi:hypothetical protein
MIQSNPSTSAQTAKMASTRHSQLRGSIRLA